MVTGSSLCLQICGKDENGTFTHILPKLSTKHYIYLGCLLISSKTSHFC